METTWNILSGITWWTWILIVLAVVAIRDVFFQKSHTISHNFPIVGHLRYWLESIGQKCDSILSQTIGKSFPSIEIERGWIYASAKQETITRVLVPIAMFMHISIFSSKIKC